MYSQVCLYAIVSSGSSECDGHRVDNWRTKSIQVIFMDTLYMSVNFDIVSDSSFQPCQKAPFIWKE